MKPQLSFPVLVLLLSTVFWFGCQPTEPDLTIADFMVDNIRVQTDDISGEEYLLADATVIVRNIGQAACNNPFWIATGQGCKKGEEEVEPDFGHTGWTFTTGSFEDQIRWKCRALEPNEEVVFTGTMNMGKVVRAADLSPDNPLIGATKYVWVVVDPVVSTKRGGDVTEADETNNKSVEVEAVTIAPVS